MNISQADSLPSGFQTPLSMDYRIAQAMPQSPPINMGGVQSDPTPGVSQEDNSGNSSTSSNGVLGPDGVVRDGNGDPVRASGAGNADAVIRSVLGGSGNDPTPGSNGSGTATTATPIPSGNPATTPGGATPTGTATTTSTPATPLQGRDPDLIYVGEKIKLPDGSTYTVKAGDTLSGIARDRGVTLAKLMELNGFNPKLLDEYANGRLVKAHHVGDLMMPGSPGVVTTGTPQTTLVPATGSTTETETDPNKPNFPAKTLLEKLDAYIGPIANKDQIRDALQKVAEHQKDPTQPELTAAEVTSLKTFMTDYGNAMLEPKPLWGNGDPPSSTTPVPVSEPSPEPTTYQGPGRSNPNPQNVVMPDVLQRNQQRA
jgi:LysM repeat protein